MTIAPEKTTLETGRVVAIAGPVVDVEFPPHSLPEINHAIEVDIVIDGATITVTGACCTCGTLPGIRAGFRRCLAAGVVTKTRRAGEQLAEVGPSFTRSYKSCSSFGSTGSGSHAW